MDGTGPDLLKWATSGSSDKSITLRWEYHPSSAQQLESVPRCGPCSSGTDSNSAARDVVQFLFGQFRLFCLLNFFAHDVSPLKQFALEGLNFCLHTTMRKWCSKGIRVILRSPKRRTGPLRGHQALEGKGSSTRKIDPISLPFTHSSTRVWLLPIWKHTKGTVSL